MKNIQKFGMSKTEWRMRGCPETQTSERNNTNYANWTHQEMNTRNQEMKNMSRSYRYTLEDYTLKNRQKRSGKNKLAWSTYREQSRDVSEMSQIEGFGGNHKKWNFWHKWYQTNTPKDEHKKLGDGEDDKDNNEDPNDVINGAGYVVLDRNEMIKKLGGKA